MFRGFPKFTELNIDGLKELIYISLDNLRNGNLYKYLFVCYRLNCDTREIVEEYYETEKADFTNLLSENILQFSFDCCNKICDNVDFISWLYKIINDDTLKSLIILMGFYHWQDSEDEEEKELYNYIIEDLTKNDKTYVLDFLSNEKLDKYKIENSSIKGFRLKALDIIKAL